MSDMYKGWVHSFKTGSTRGNINAKTLGNMVIPIPSRKQQDGIVNMLSSIDEKVKGNNEINKNLANNEPCVSVGCDASGSSLTHGVTPTDSYGDKRYEHVA